MERKAAKVVCVCVMAKGTWAAQVGKANEQRD